MQSERRPFYSRAVNPRPWPWTPEASPATRKSFWSLIRSSIPRVVLVNNVIVGIPALLSIYLRLHPLGFFAVDPALMPSLTAFIGYLCAALVIEVRVLHSRGAVK